MTTEMNGLTAEVSTHGTRTIVALAGEIDLSNHVALRGALNDLITNGSVDLVLDLTGVTFMDSTGLGALIGTRRRVHAFQGSLAIVLTHDALTTIVADRQVVQCGGAIGEFRQSGPPVHLVAER